LPAFLPAWCINTAASRPAAQQQAETLLALATTHAFPHWVAQGTMLRGWALTMQGQGEEGLAQIRQGLSVCRALGTQLTLTHWLALLAEACEFCEQHSAGLLVVTEALALGEQHGERFYMAELSRLQGELLLHASARQGGQSNVILASEAAPAEACFQQALALARGSQAKAWELRAALSLSRLWQRQGRRTEARQLLAEVYGWFTEGLDTADLRAARAFLDELA
jgi:predicted ATPase